MGCHVAGIYREEGRAGHELNELIGSEDIVRFIKKKAEE